MNEELNQNMILPANLQLPKNIEDVIKLSRSLTHWLEFIKNNPDGLDDAMSSYGGNLETHILYLDYWMKTEKVRVVARIFEKGGVGDAKHE